METRHKGYTIRLNRDFLFTIDGFNQERIRLPSLEAAKREIDAHLAYHVEGIGPPIPPDPRLAIKHKDYRWAYNDFEAAQYERGYGDPFYDDLPAAIQAVEDDVAQKGEVDRVLVLLRRRNEISWADFWEAARRGLDRFDQARGNVRDYSPLAGQADLFALVAPGKDPIAVDPTAIKPPNPEECTDIREGFRLFPFQVEAANAMAAGGRWLLADEMGVGKTATAIHWAKDRKPVLIICPASLVLNWERELLRNWRRCDSVVVLDGQRELYPGSGLPQWTIVSYGQLERYMPALKVAGFQTVICDEAHYFKNASSARGAAVISLVSPKEPEPGQKLIPNRLAVTGTPMPNRPVDLWQLLLFLEVTKSPFDRVHNTDTWSHKDWPFFRDAYGAADANSTRLKVLNETLETVMIRRKKATVYPDMPPKHVGQILVPITTSQLYKEKDTEFRNWLKGAMGSARGADRMAALRRLRGQILARLQELRAIAARGKVQPVADWLRGCTAEGGKVLVFSSFVEPLKELESRLGNSVVYTGELSKQERQAKIDQFQQPGGTCFFLGTYGAAGVGITLTQADRVVLFDLPWTPAEKQQAEDRAHRYGQKRPVTVTQVIAKGTVDERVLELLAEKEQMIGQLIDGLSQEAAARQSVATRLMQEFALGEVKTVADPVPYVADPEDGGASTPTLFEYRDRVKAKIAHGKKIPAGSLGTFYDLDWDGQATVIFDHLDVGHGYYYGRPGPKFSKIPPEKLELVSRRQPSAGAMRSKLNPPVEIGRAT